MPQQSAAGAASTESAASFANAHRKLLADSSIQFDFSHTPPQEVPHWLRWLGSLIHHMLPVLRILFFVGAGLLALYILALVANRFWGVKIPWRRSAPASQDDGGSWRPAEAPARALLKEADALAHAGRFSEAAHLLLFRSIEDIDSRRPALVRPALTSRDIAGASQLPEGPRTAFGRIVQAVETSLFGGRALGEQDWRECRDAYEQFAFAGAWR